MQNHGRRHLVSVSNNALVPSETKWLPSASSVVYPGLEVEHSALHCFVPPEIGVMIPVPGSNEKKIWFPFVLSHNIENG